MGGVGAVGRSVWDAGTVGGVRCGHRGEVCVGCRRHGGCVGHWRHGGVRMGCGQCGGALWGAGTVGGRMRGAGAVGGHVWPWGGTCGVRAPRECWGAGTGLRGRPAECRVGRQA